MTTTLQFPPEVIARAEQASAIELPVMQQAARLVIVDQETATIAGETYTAIRRHRKRIKEEFKSLRDAANKAAADALALERKADAPWAEAEARIRGTIEEWDDECERTRLELERAARMEREQREAEARRVADIERARLQAAADAATLAAAAEAEAAGDPDEAARILETAPVVVAPVPIVAPVPPVALAPQAKVPGAAIRRPWRYLLEDATKVVRAYLVPNEKAIAATVKALGPAAVAAVGEGSITVYQDRIVAGAATRPKTITTGERMPASVVTPPTDEETPW